MIKIIIADDQRLMRDGLQTMISLADDMEVVGHAENGRQAYELAANLRPDLVLMDIQMPMMDGIEGTKLIRQHVPGTRVLILTTFADDDYIVDGLVGGACGFLLKDLPGEKIIQSIRDAVSGQLMLPAVIAAKLAARLSYLSPGSQPAVNVPALKRLGISFTDREKTLIRLMIDNKSNKQMAGILFVSEGTLRNYISAIYNKIGTNDRMEAIRVLKELVEI